jgi:type I restriction enzyme S subunit
MKIVKLGEVCNLVGGGTPSKKNSKFYTGSIPWITVRDMKQRWVESTEFCITEEAIKASATNLIPKNTVVIASRVGLGKVIQTSVPMAINQDLRAFVPKKPEILDSNFLFYWAQSIRDLIIGEGKGATVQGITLPFIQNLDLPLPSLPEQKAIVEKLDAAFAEIDKLETNLQTNINNLANNQDGLVDYVFKKYSNKLLSCKLRDVAEYSNGTAHEKIIDPDGKYIVVNSKFISKDGLPVKRTNRQLSPLKKGDLAMVLSDVPNGKTLAKCYLVPEDDVYTLNQRICKVRSKTLVPGFLYFNLNRNAYLLSFNNSENQTNLRLEDVLNTPMFRADSSTQNSIVKEIALLVTQFRKIEELNYSKLLLLRDLRLSILSSAFTEESNVA